MIYKKICLLGSTGRSGGVIRYSKEIISNFRKDPNGFIIYNREYERPFQSPAMNFMLGASKEDFSGYDLIHNLPAYPYYPVSRPSAIIVATAHEFQRRTVPELNSLQERNFSEKLWGSLVVEKSIEQMLKSDYLMANSIQTKNEAVELGYDKNRLFYTPFGLDERFFAKQKRRKEGKIFRVGFIGTLSERKNISLLLKAFGHIENKNIILELWGNNLYHEGELDLPKNVVMKGPAPEKKVVEIYDSFDLFVYMSSYEGYGIPIQEAKARGLPVIIYKHGHISEEVKKYCFEAEDDGHLAQLIEDIRDNGYNEKMRREATRYARSFTWERTADETLKSYKKIFYEAKA